jgi:5-dehydro-4-deoxyglucarate dehydratase
MNHDDLRRRLSRGVLAFPATVFDPAGELDEVAFGDHIADLVAWRPAAVVSAGGAGEIFSLSLREQQRAVAIAVEKRRDVPVIAGVGQGLAQAREMAAIAEKEGADGVLLFPPYLVQSEQQGLAAYVAQVCAAVSIPVVNLVALKDGVGDFEALVGLASRTRGRLALVNGVPTAEIVARQFFAAGVTSYSSAVFTFLPAVANRFYLALDHGEAELVDRLLAEFYVPLTAIRRRRKGYAVAIVKAGLRVMGKPAGMVRPPLVDLSSDEIHELEGLIGRAAAIVADAADKAGSPAAKE